MKSALRLSFIIIFLSLAETASASTLDGAATLFIGFPVMLAFLVINILLSAITRLHGAIYLLASIVLLPVAIYGGLITYDTSAAINNSEGFAPIGYAYYWLYFCSLASYIAMLFSFFRRRRATVTKMS